MSENKKPKIGVFICHCGTNIAGNVDVEKLAERFNKVEGVVAYHTMFLCSQIGQNLIKDKIIEHNLEKVVVASCSPKHHGEIFKLCIGQKLNPYMWEMANIREQCAWSTQNREDATEKAKALITGAIEKAKLLTEIGKTSVPVTKDVLVIGGGIAGMKAALEMTDKGFHVNLVEKKPIIGGHMAQLDRTFPTDDCAMCTISPVLNDVGNNSNIRLITNSEVVEVKGHPGEYKVKILKKPRFVREDKCTGCGECAQHCPVEVPNEFDMNLGIRGAIHIPFAQGVPLRYLIDKESCIRCGTCKSTCKNEAIDYDQKEETLELVVGSIIVATGYDEYNLKGTEYRKEHPNVISGLELERLLSPAGPTAGKLLRPFDGKIPKSVIFIQCAGSRDKRHRLYCSKICCMYATKNARLIKKDHPETDVKVCYIDLRAAGRNYEEYYDKAREMGIKFIRGNVSEIVPKGENLIVKMEDTLLGQPVELEAELVVLSVALIPSEGTKKMAEVIHLITGPDGFLVPVHPKIAPVDTTTTGIFIAGTAEAPKPIQESITDAGAAASRVATMLGKDELTVDLTTSRIIPDKCIKCDECVEGCNYDAIDTEGETYKVTDVSCHSCGKCVSVCPANAMQLRYFTDEQIERQVDGILSEAPSSIIAFACNQCGYNAADLAGTAKYYYSPKVKVVMVPCSGRLSLNHMLYPFEKGACGVMIAACLEGQCHYIDGNIAAKEKVALAKKVLDLTGISGEKLQLFNMSSAEGEKFAQAARRMAEICQ